MAKKTKMNDHHISDDLEAELGNSGPSDDQLKTIAQYAVEAVSIEDRLSDLDELAKKLRQDLHQINTRKIPDAMAAAGTSEFKLQDGTKITVGDLLTGTLPKEEDRRSAALQWLEAEGAEDMIKSEIDLAFSRGARKDQLAVEKALAKLGATYTKKEGVHPQTLQAFARERLKNGESVPLDLLGLYSIRMAKITRPKAK